MLRIVIITSLLASPAEARFGPPRVKVSRSGILSVPKRIARNIGATGVVVSGGLNFGIPAGVAGVSGGVGLAVGQSSKAAGARHGLLPFASAKADGPVFALKGVASPAKTGVERSVGVGPLGIGTGDPIYGDRVSFGLPFASLSLSRKGGMGFSLEMPMLLALPAPFLWPFARQSFSLYVSNPLLAPVSSWTLDRVDHGVAGAKHFAGPTIGRVAAGARATKGWAGKMLRSLRTRRTAPREGSRSPSAAGAVAGLSPSTPR